jgi:hypothetical protein
VDCPVCADVCGCDSADPMSLVRPSLGYARPLLPFTAFFSLSVVLQLETYLAPGNFLLAFMPFATVTSQ